jgi:hypothetical protein
MSLGVVTFALEGAKDVNRNVVMNLRLACDLLSAERVAKFTSM